MKKLLLSLLAVIVSVCAFADNTTKLTEGSAAFLKNGGIANVVFNWADAKHDNKEPLRNHWKENYDTMTVKGEQGFIDGFNAVAKKVKIDNAEKAQYRIEVNITNVDYFFSVMSIVPGHKHRVSAQIRVVDVSSGETLCVIKVDQRKGSRDFVVTDSFVKTMNQIGQDVAKLK